MSEFIRGLVECRKRLIRSMAVTLIATLALFPLARPLFTWFAKPLWQHLPITSQLIAVDLVSSFWVPLELSLLVALVITAPWWLLELWWWVTPGLYLHERCQLALALCSSMVLFLIGLMFAYTLVLPLMIRFLLFAVPKEVVMMPDIAVYLDFSLRLLWCFGGLFELPLVIVAVLSLGWLSKDQLKSWRRYVIVGAFIIGMIVAPDPLSQCLVALPLYGLYELGLCLACLPLAIRHSARHG